MDNLSFYLREHFSYSDAFMGFIWKKNPSKRNLIGKKCGRIKDNGYVQIKFMGKNYYEHRLVWFFHHGEWPHDQIDHINGLRSDNRISNLREATAKQNQGNKLKSQGCSSSTKGVMWDKGRGKWRSYININGRYKYLGRFASEKDASDAYMKAAEDYFGEFSRRK